MIENKETLAPYTLDEAYQLFGGKRIITRIGFCRAIREKQIPHLILDGRLYFPRQRFMNFLRGEEIGVGGGGNQAA